MGLSLFHWALAAGMLVTGSINTLSTKAADQECSVNRHGNKVDYNHSFVQAVGMFVGEFLCLVAFTLLSCRARSKGDESFPRAKPHSKLIFVLPALCDMTATSVMYVGLSLTSSSMFQMLRGSVVIFTGILSVLFLKRKLRPWHWLGMALVLAGTGVVGTSTLVCKDAGCGGASSGPGGDSKAMTGNVLIIAAQVIVAIQMVVEEKLIGGYDIPALQVVGWEGLWGFSILAVVVGVMYKIPAPSDFCSPTVTCSQVCNGPTYNADCDHFEDAYDAFVQMGNDWKIIAYTLLNIGSIAFFNFLGVSITKHVNAATRMVMDSLRTMVIWGFSLGIGWESFCYVQVIGFVVLLLGTLVYNEVLKVPGFRYDAAGVAPAGDDESDSAALLAGGDGEDDYAVLEGGASLNAAYPVRGIKSGRK